MKRFFYNTEINKFIIQYAIVLLIIFGSGDTIPMGSNRMLRFSIQIILCFMTFIVGGLKKELKYTMVISGILSIVILLSMIFNDDWHGYTMWLLLLIAALVSNAINFEEYMKCLDNVVCVIAVLSLIGTFTLLIVPQIYNYLPIINAGRSYKNMFFIVFTPNEIPYSLMGYLKTNRNYGIFREPAMFCIYLGLGLIQNLVIQTKPSWIKVIILMVTILTTKSMTGYVAAVFLFMLYIFLNRKDKRLLLITSVVACFSMLIAVKFDVIPYIISRFNINGSSRHSVISRLYSVIVGLMVGKDNILFGAGATKSQVLFEEYSTRLIVDMGVCWANMVTYLFASFGVIFVCIFLVGIFGTGLYSDRGIASGWIILLFFSLLLCGEIMTYSPIMFVFMMFGWKRILERGTKCSKIKCHC